MPINCLINCPINSFQFVFNSWTIRVPKQINGFLMNQFMNINVSKNGPFVLRLLSFVSSSLFLSLCLFVSSSLPLFSSLFLSFPLLLSLFNTHPARPTNFLKTKDLRKRHFILKFLSPGKTLRLRTLGKKFAQWFVHFPAAPTLHTLPKPALHAPPRNPALCRLSCRICRPNPTHLTPLIIKF